MVTLYVFMRVAELKKGKHSSTILYGRYSEYVPESNSMSYAKRSNHSWEQNTHFRSHISIALTPQQYH